MASNRSKSERSQSPPLMKYAALLLAVLGPSPGCSDEFHGKSPSSFHRSFRESLSQLIVSSEEHHFAKWGDGVPRVRRLLKRNEAKKVTSGNTGAVSNKRHVVFRNDRVFVNSEEYSQKERRRRSSLRDIYPSDGKRFSLDYNLADYDGMFDYTTFFYSEHYHVFLCNHPPNTYSANFLQHSEEECENYSFFYNHNELTTYAMCDFIYERIHGKSLDLERAWEIMLDNETFMTLVSDEDFVSICLPLFRRFNSCKEKKYLTICADESIVFLHSHECQPPSYEDSYFHVFLALAAVEDRYSCFQCVCHGWRRIIETKSPHGITFTVSENYISSIHEDFCLECNDIVTPLYFLARENQTKCFVNRLFLSCYAYDLVLWRGSTNETILREFWKVLPASCKATEILMTCILGLILLAGLIGNPLVIFVTCSRPDNKDWPLKMLQRSLAFSDLLLFVFVTGPCFYNRTMQLSGYWNADLNGDPSSNKDCLSGLLHINNRISFPRTWSTDEVISRYHIFQTVIFNTCISVSLLTLFSLSLELLVIVKASQKLVIYISSPYIQCSVISMIWILGIIDGLLFSFDGNGDVISISVPVHHYPLGLSSFRFWPLRTFVLYRIFICQVLCWSTVVISFLLIKNFQRDHPRTDDKGGHFKRSFSAPYTNENIPILVSLSVTSLLFFISISPYLFCHYETITSRSYFPRWPLMKHSSQLLAKAPSAWNPWVYLMSKAIASKWR
ncbi:uncharacterized protein LOC135211147 [Macrobrachium nipponense]|uniref:uncharacterized protein LOC135211147 n=1 Tax=Macrobrachium nipponense TaxID=159736 RepID=UPI0030C83EF3